MRKRNRSQPTSRSNRAPRLRAALLIATLSATSIQAHDPVVVPIPRQEGPASVLALETQKPHLTFSITVLDFGAVTVGTGESLELSVTNVSTRDIDVTWVAPTGVVVGPGSCATAVAPVGFDLPPGASTCLSVTWSPPVAGSLTAELRFTVTHDGAEEALVETVPTNGLASVAPGTVESTTWRDFVEAQATGIETVLPDFSYAGYRHSREPIPDRNGPYFDVKTFGAIPDDGLSDRDAIQATVDAAALAGGGVVLFPPGVFHLNTASNAEDPIRIEHDNIVLRGAGMNGAPTGTTLAMERHQLPIVACQLASAPFMVQFGLPDNHPAPTQLATIVADARRETTSVTVDSAAAIDVGDWVTVSFESNRDAVFDSFLAPQTRPACDPNAPARCWTRGIQIKERHQVAAIEGQRVTFADPLKIDIARGVLVAGEAWRLVSYPHLEEVGVEHLLFEGGWTRPFVHHGSNGSCGLAALPENCTMPQQDCIAHDSAWSAVFFDSVVESWVRNVRFRDWNQSLVLFESSAISVLGVDFEGNKGHFSVHTRGGTGNLIGVSRDLASHHHGPSVGYGSAATVFWRFAYPGDTSFDAHSSSPYATLHDRTAGGLRHGRAGGPHHGMPNHLRHLVLWNFEHRGAATSPFDFWTAQPRTYFVQPIIIGFHRGAGSLGNVTFAPEDLALEELHDQEASPASLFEAQLTLRAGELPAWLAALRDGAP